MKTLNYAASKDRSPKLVSSTSYWQEFKGTALVVLLLSTFGLLYCIATDTIILV